MQSKVHALRRVDYVVCSCGELILLLVYIVAFKNMYKTEFFVCTGRWHDDIFYYFLQFLFHGLKFQKYKICTIMAAQRNVFRKL